VPVEPLPDCGAGGGTTGPEFDVEGTLVCDVDASGNVIGVALVEAVYDEATGARTGTRLVSVVDGTPYVPVGTIQPCPEGCCPEPVVLCDVQPDGSSVQFVRAYAGQTDGGLTTTDQLLDGTPYTPTGTVGDCDPYTLCTPDSNQDLNGDCGPGEPASQAVILADGQAPNSVVTDDPTADALCGGTWGPGPDPQSPPFPVDESFRNGTFDQPGPVTQGTAPYAGLTASPGFTGSNVDPAGDGWLQTSDINSGTNGIWQVPAPFPTAAGATASITFTSHDGTAQGGDGMAFVFTDGSVGAQATPIGGFGNLGLQNWQGGYVAVVLDEYGQTCTCDHTAPPGGPFAGPCGFCTNTISIQLAGTARQGASCACCTIATASVAPHQINGTTRSTPGRLIVSIIEEAGQTYVSASVIWPGDTEPVQYFNRVNVTACAGPSPASLRMAVYGGSGGSFRSEHEFRDAQAIAAGIQDWRAFPIVTDPIPACVTQVDIHAEVDVTFVSDTQTSGNADNEAFFWLVNTATNTIVDRGELSSLPSQVGNVHHLTIDSGLIPVADLPNYRIYVGAETRDQSGSYGHLWENLDISVSGAGCPVVPRRTLEISATCPIPVTIVGGGTGDGGGSAPSVFNAPATFEDAEICITIAGVRQQGFRREVRTPDGAIAFSFLGTDGIPITPDTWTPGACECGDTELLEICDLGTDPPTPFVRRVTYNCAGEVASAEDVDYVGVPYVPVGVAGRCDACAPIVLDQVCVISTDFPGVTLPATAVQACDGSVTYINADTGDPWSNVTSVVICPPPNTPWEQILCDQGNDGHQFRRVYNLTPLGSVITYDEEFDTTPYVPVGPVGVCCSNSATVLVCDLPTGDPDGIPTVTDSGQQFIADTANADFIQRPGGGGALWTGGVINFGPDVSPGPGPITQIHRYASATLQAVPPSCTDGTVHLSLSVEVLNQGPGAGCSGAGRFRLYRVSDGAVLASGSPLFNTPVGATVVLTIEADIADVELNTGNVAVWLDVETWQTGTCTPPDSKTWQASQFTAAYTYGQEGCATQFFRTIVTDCQTGSVVAISDSDLDGNPYVLTGDAGECTTGSGDTTTAQTPESLALCDITVVPSLDGARSALNLTTLPNGPTAGAFANGIGFTVDQGVPGGSGTYLITTGTTQNWTFSEPAMLRFGVNNLNVGAECVTLPVGTVVESIHANHVYNSLTRVLCNGGAAAGIDESIFTLDAATTLAITSNPGGGGQRGLVRLEAGLTTFTEVRTPFLRTICRTCGAVPVVTDTAMDAVTPYVLVGTVGVCDVPFTPAEATTLVTRDVEQQILCDTTPTRFLRRYVYDGQTGAIASFTDTTLDGSTAFAPVGAVGVCPTGAGRDEELLVLCDATPTRFLRRYNYDSSTGALLSIVNTTLDGSTAFVPVGAVGVCTTAIASDFDFLSTVLCDANGTQFIQRLTFNSATGAVTATTNTTLTGAAFAPVAPVALCSSCCPVVMGEGCTNVGSLRYTALRLANGTISLIDSVTGAAVLPANIVACAPANGVLPNVAADHFEAIPGTPWTPAAIPAGRRLVSLTYTVLTGTATVVDATGGTSIATIPAGYSATWTAQDDRETLTPPASVTSVGGRVIVLMLTAA